MRSFLNANKSIISNFGLPLPVEGTSLEVLISIEPTNVWQINSIISDAIGIAP